MKRVQSRSPQRKSVKLVGLTIFLVIALVTLFWVEAASRTDPSPLPVIVLTNVGPESTRREAPQTQRQWSQLLLSDSDGEALGILQHQDADALDSLLTCPSVRISGDDNPTSTEKNSARYQRCFYTNGTQFLYFGNHWGRHFNQMTSLIAALVLSKMLHRTLVVPPFVFENKRVHLYDLYDARGLFTNLNEEGGSPFCILTEDEFNRLERQRVGMSRDSTAVIAVEASCISMRGIKQHPQLPRGFMFQCVESPFIKFKKNLKLFFDVVGHSSARMLTIPLAIYYAHALPERVVHCPWRLLAPHPAVAKAVQLLYTDASPSHEAGSVPMRGGGGGLATIGVHLRSLEGSCHARQQQYKSREEAQGLEQQCTMKADYVLGVARAAFARDPVRKAALLSDDGQHIRRGANVHCIIADDGQQPVRAEALAKELPNAVRTQNVVAGSITTPVKAYVDSLRQGPPSISETQQDPPGEEPPYDVRSRFHIVPGALPLLLDFWALANATVFVGNQVSTLSVNVCRYRRAVGATCDNFV
jgi:hypothetical protein